MAATKKIIAAGYDRVYWSFLNSDGYAIGQGSSLSAGTPGSSAGKLDGVKTSAVTIPEPEVVTITGDDQALGQFIFAPTETPSFNIEVGMNDLDFLASAQGTLVATDGNISFGLLEPDFPDFPDFCLIMQRRAKSKDAATSGTSRWEGIIIPKANVVPLGSDNFGEKAPATFKYKVSTNVSNFFPWAKALSNGTNGSTGAPIIMFTSQYRVCLHTFKAGASQTGFGPLTYTPAGSDITANVLIYVNGVLQTANVTVDVNTKMLTFSPAPATDALVHVLYEHLA